MKTVKWFAKAFAAGVIAIMISSVFCYFYYNPGSHITSKTGATDYVWLPNKMTYRSTEGFGKAKTDKNGYFNTFGNDDFGFDILLMGSSHMEAGNVTETENTAYLINDILSENSISLYNIGISGHDFLRCVKNLPVAIEKFRPNDYVVIETSAVEFNADDVDALINGEMKNISSHDSGLLFELQKITALKLLYSQLEGAVESFFEQFEEKDNESSNGVGNDSPNPESEEYLNKLTEHIENIANENNVRIIVFYHPTLALNKDGTLSLSDDRESVRLFAEACKDEGIVFIDMTNEFCEMYETEHVLPHGFSNTSHGEGHLNKYGHRAIAKKISETVIQLKEEK